MHDYDAEVDDLSRDGQIKNTVRLHKALDAFVAIDPATLPAIDRNDREMLISSRPAIAAHPSRQNRRQIQHGRK